MTTIETVPKGTAPKKVKHRSPNFPSISLKEAIDKVKLLYDADKQSGSTRESAFKHLGYKGQSGASLGIVSALKKFDLIKEVNDRILVTDKARFILVLSENDEKRKDSLKKCALSPEIYKELWSKYKESGLPSDETLRSELITDYNFNEKSVLKFITDFKETLRFANIEAGQDNEDLEDSENLEKKPSDVSTLMRAYKEQKRQYLDTTKVSEYKIPRKGNKLAILTLETPVSQKDIESIGKWLELLKDTLIEEDEEEENEFKEYADDETAKEIKDNQ